MHKYYLIFLFLLVCVGCRLGPKYKLPETETPAAWKNDRQEGCCEAPCFTGLWWEVFADSVLDGLETCAITNNPNLYAALDRVAQARAIAGADKAALYPQIALNPGYSNMGTLFKIYLPTGVLPGVTVLQNSFRVHELQYSLPFTMNYELDLWGKLAGQYDSAYYNAQAQADNFQTALLTLTADVASSYFQLRSLDGQIAYLQRNLDWLRKNEKLVQSRFSKGLVNYQDVAGAVQQLATTEAAYYDVLRQRALQEDVVATLIGMPASEFCLEANPLAGEPPCIPPGLPSEVLAQRPDIAAAERNMASEHALIGVAYASFLPSIQLTGLLGYYSPQLNDFMHWKSRLWSMAANAALPIFDAGRNQSNLDLSYAHFKESSHAYQQTVLTAFQEVEDALVNLDLQHREYESYRRAAEASEKRIQLSNRRYLQGLVGYLEVIDSERTGIEVEVSKIAMLGARYISTVQLIKAIGGPLWGLYEARQESVDSQCEDSSSPSDSGIEK